jgi:hypothetical protein
VGLTTKCSLIYSSNRNQESVSRRTDERRTLRELKQDSRE